MKVQDKWVKIVIPIFKSQKKIQRLKIKSRLTFLTRLTSRLSCWNKIKRVVATVVKWLPDRKEIGVEDIEDAETRIICLVQQEAVRQEWKDRESQSIQKMSP